MTADREYIAHIRQSDGKAQTVVEHLEAVREGCEVFGQKIGAAHLAGMAGLLHDMGKNTNSFREYISKAVENPDHPPAKGSVDHSTAGGKWIYERYHSLKTSEDKIVAEWIANCVISHHQGLRDYFSPEGESPFLDRVVKKQEGMEEYGQTVAVFLAEWPISMLDDYYGHAKKELRQLAAQRKKKKMSEFTYSLLIKYIFSCLIDADRTDSRQFEEGRREGWSRDHSPFFQRSYEALLQHLEAKNKGDHADHPINQLRRSMSEACDRFASNPSGIYTLSIPTGGGKTLASLRYALKHAVEHGKERIIYIVPYTTVIEQNASEIRSILNEDDQILEHHSNVIDQFDPVSSAKDYDLAKERLSLARDNWDRPLIFTTMVQFLNSFYAKGTRNARRLHRLTNAVIVFDEVQSVPSHCISLFNEALNFLHSYGNSCLVLCTATQPALDYVNKKLLLSPDGEIMGEDAAKVHQSPAFQRVHLELAPVLSEKLWTTSDVANFLCSRMNDSEDNVNSILVIHNTKSAARKLYTQLKKEEWVQDQGIQLYHLSTSMCPAHRKDTLDEVRKGLKEHKPIICISTQLIEAGVDISFQCVLRSLAGLDSIAQAAGRCNRHGEVESRNVYVFRSAEENLSRLKEIEAAGAVTCRLLREVQRNPQRFGGNLLSQEAMRQYFEYVYYQLDNSQGLDYLLKDKGTLYELLDRNRKNKDYYRNKHGHQPDLYWAPAWATAEEHFEVISNSTRSVLVPYHDEAGKSEADRVIADLNGADRPEKLGELLREAQQYVVNLYEYEWQELSQGGYLHPLLHGNCWVSLEQAYSKNYGIDLKGEGAETSFAGA